MRMRHIVWINVLLTLLIIVGVGAWGYLRYVELEERDAIIRSELLTLRKQVDALPAQFRSELTKTTGDITKDILRVEDKLSETKEESTELAKRLELEQEKITESVGTLEKLTKTDPELLQKYSKVFFLNEHYAPPRLEAIEKKYLYIESESQRIHAEVYPFLMTLLRRAERDGVELYVKSAFRSFNEQINVKSAHVIVYGEGTANQFSAEQGYSEHQLGTTVDFITTGIGGTLEGFETTEAYEWMLKNAHKFGFILSYPEDNQYYTYEPWHWRFVGVALAKKLHAQDKQFYDMDQRDIDEYLVRIFE